MAEWITIEQQQPEYGQFVVANIKEGNHFYHEILKLDTDNIWKHNNGDSLKDGAIVNAWKHAPSTFLS